MVLPLKRTLGDIRAEIQSRVGFGMAGQAGVVNSPIIDSFLRSAQEQLYIYDWSELKSTDVRLTGVNQQFYDYPVNCNVDRIQQITIKFGGQSIKLKEGIEYTDRDFPVSSVPMRFERRDQLEIWPIPQSQYEMRTEYVKTLLPFIKNDDRTSIPSEMVFLHALANAKQHYRQPDAATYASQLDALLKKLKQSHRSRTVFGSQHKITPYDVKPISSQMV
jgi:hypothetical protein